MMPKVSIIMPAYNSEKYIAEAIDSILNQTYADFEFIIINDGSQDKTKDIILSYSDHRIVYLENKENQGIVGALNRGIDSSKGKYIARFDADDIAVSTRLEKQVLYMESHEDVCVLGTGIKIFGENIKTQTRVFSVDSNKLKAELLFSSCVAHPTVMIRKKILDENKLKYDTDFAGVEDYHLWWRIAQIGKIETLTEILHEYRIHENQITQKYTEKDKKILENFIIIRMNDLKITLTETERKVFLNYCCGEYNPFFEEEINCFIDILSRVIKNNQENKYFRQTSLKEACGQAVTCLISNSSIGKLNWKKCYKYAVRKKIYPYDMRMKLFYHKTFR